MKRLDDTITLATTIDHRRNRREQKSQSIRQPHGVEIVHDRWDALILREQNLSKTVFGIGNASGHKKKECRAANNRVSDGSNPLRAGREAVVPPKPEIVLFEFQHVGSNHLAVDVCVAYEDVCCVA